MLKHELNINDIQNILVMGKSGAGKQPRIDVFIEEFGLQQLSTGDIFRSYLKVFDQTSYPGKATDFYDKWANVFIPDSEMKKKIKPYLNGQSINDVLMGIRAKYYVINGLFVPDTVTNQLFHSSFKSHKFAGVVHDGYPRTVDQAKYLTGLLKEKNKRIDLILLVDSDDRTILTRITGRRICPNCKKVFHMEYKPLKDGKYCTHCGALAVTRIDDKQESVLTRLKEYQEKTLPAIEYLTSLGIPRIVVPGNLPLLTYGLVKASVLNALANSQVKPFEFEHTG